jgi:hypothetical protein
MLGAIITNNSDLVAYRTQVDFHVSDRRDRSLVDQTPPGQRTVVSVILPGQRIGVGREISVPLGGESSASSAVTEVTGFELKMSTAQWWRPDRTTRTTFHPVVTRHQQTKRVSANVGDISYSVDSRLCGAVVRDGLSIVFRDRAGVITGGLSVPAGGSCVPGRRDEVVRAADLPDDADDRKIEIYPYCDLVGDRS